MFNTTDNIIALADSYKFSHFSQYPEGTKTIQSHMIARGVSSNNLGLPKDIKVDRLVFFGLKYYLKLLDRGITSDNINEAEALSKVHGVPFNTGGWWYLLRKHNGRIPLAIRALPEGTLAKVGEPLLTIENSDPEFPWLVGWFETLLMKLWYPVTVATKSYYVKQMLKRHWDETSDNPEGVDFSYHNFGDRGSTSVEAAALGGLAHLTQFKGTDNFNALRLAKALYNGAESIGFSIPATEHSTVTSWGKDNEFAMIESYLESYKGKTKDYHLIACVLDSYNIYEAVEFVANDLKSKIESEDYPMFVIRPDSGEPLDVISTVLRILEEAQVSCSINSKGYKVLAKYRIIWGDGITPKVIDEILKTTKALGYAADNFAFGSGGDLMQNVGRDDLKFAIKANAIQDANGCWREVYKEPVTDPGKKSLRGYISDPRLDVTFHKSIAHEAVIYGTFSNIRNRSKT